LIVILTDAYLMSHTKPEWEETLFPKYRDIELPLVAELRIRGGKSHPQDRDAKGRNIYEALADHFQLSQEEREECIYENGKARSKWHNMVRYAVRKLRDGDVLDNLAKGERGIWKISER
jgi:restriction endonuclease Mrr